MRSKYQLTNERYLGFQKEVRYLKAEEEGSRQGEGRKRRLVVESDQCLFYKVFVVTSSVVNRKGWRERSSIVRLAVRCCANQRSRFERQ